MKKIVLFLFLVVISVFLLSFSASAEITHIFGDTDQNGKINANDALLILRYAVGKSTIEPDLFCYSDTNTDYSVNATDALNVLKYSVGKIQQFAADNDFEGSIYIPERYNDIFMQLGCTRAVACYFESLEADYTVVWDVDSKYITGQWTEEWAEDENGDLMVLFLTAEANPYKTQSIPVRVFYKESPGIYRTIMVEVAPTDADLITAYNFVKQWTPDFGDMNYTAPYYMDYLDFGDHELITLRYDGTALLENTNGATELYNDYLYELEEYNDFVFLRYQEGEHTLEDEAVFTNAEENVWIYAELYEDEYGDQIVELQFVNVY